MKAYVLCRAIEFADGARMNIPLGLFSEQPLAEKAMHEDSAKLKLLASSVLMLQNGMQLPFAVALQELGIKIVGNEGGEIDVKTSELVVAEKAPVTGAAPRIILAR